MSEKVTRSNVKLVISREATRFTGARPVAWGFSCELRTKDSDEYVAHCCGHWHLTAQRAVDCGRKAWSKLPERSLR